MSAKFVHHMPDDLHRQVKDVAKQKKISVTKLINNVMADYVGVALDDGFIAELRQRIEKLEQRINKE
jgi:hypothetical protein